MSCVRAPIMYIHYDHGLGSCAECRHFPVGHKNFYSNGEKLTWVWVRVLVYNRNWIPMRRWGARVTFISLWRPHNTHTETRPSKPITDWNLSFTTDIHSFITSFDASISFFLIWISPFRRMDTAKLADVYFLKIARTCRSIFGICFHSNLFYASFLNINLYACVTVECWITNRRHWKSCM